MYQKKKMQQKNLKKYKRHMQYFLTKKKEVNMINMVMLRLKILMVMQVVKALVDLEEIIVLVIHLEILALMIYLIIFFLVDLVHLFLPVLEKVQGLAEAMILYME